VDDYLTLREAPRPRRRWLRRYYWTIPAGLAFGFGLYAAYDGLRFTAGGFVAAGILICIVFGGIE
jgi:hypothetical protein